jgi:hypothetical protein
MLLLSILLVHDAPWLGDWSPTFRDGMFASTANIGCPMYVTISWRQFPKSRSLYWGLPSVVLYGYWWQSSPPQVRWPGHAVEHSPFITKFENAWCYDSISTCTFIVTTGENLPFICEGEGLYFVGIETSVSAGNGLWYPTSRVQTRPKPSNFSALKILSMPSFGGEVKPSVPCRRFAAC